MIAALLLACRVFICGPDAFHLARLADSAHVNADAVLAVAYEESAHNLSPLLRGHHCWYAGHHERDCEVGRFQIKPSTARARCRGLNVWTYRGNVACFLRMFEEDNAWYGDVERAVAHHNGSGKKAADYATRVLADMQRLQLRREAHT